MIAYTGPNLLNIDDEGYPLQPYGIKENLFYFRCCWYRFLVNTAYSEQQVKKQNWIFGINADVKYLANWIGGFVTYEPLGLA
jgi:hypothetical protein